MKYILMATGSNFGNMFSMAAATLYLPFLPMLTIGPISSLFDFLTFYLLLRLFGE